MTQTTSRRLAANLSPSGQAIRDPRPPLPAAPHGLPPLVPQPTCRLPWPGAPVLRTTERVAPWPSQKATFTARQHRCHPSALPPPGWRRKEERPQPPIDERSSCISEQAWRCL